MDKLWILYRSHYVTALLPFSDRCINLPENLLTYAGITTITGYAFVKDLI